MVWVISLCRESDARTIEATLRSELAKGNWGILEMKPSLKLGEFLKKDFLLFTRTRVRRESQNPAVLRQLSERTSAPKALRLTVAKSPLHK